MKYFIIWPICAAAIGLFHDEAACTATSDSQGIDRMGLLAHVGQWSCSGGSWNTSDFDDFLQEPVAPPHHCITVEGTIKEYGCDDLYDDKSDDAE